MNILVTGAKGMVGTALVNNLKNIRDNKNRTRQGISVDEIFEYDIDSTREELEVYCQKADYVFNLAGVNRPEKAEDFMNGNFGFASELLETLEKYENKAPVMLSSSVQATLAGRFGDSEYGRSKKAGEELFFQYGQKNQVKVAVYRFPNLMGHSRPKYNSAVSTFCWAIANDEEFTVNDPSVELELLYIDDGSRDGTVREVKKLIEQDSRVHIISFSRNFGKEAAMFAGLEKSKGDYVVMMDVDLQDPPSLLPEMFEWIWQGYDSVATRRVTRKGEPPIRSFFARRFYHLMKKISRTEMMDGARDYRLMTRQMVDAILSMREYNRFTKGIFGWVGFQTKWLEYENVERAKGETKWNFWKLLVYSLDGITAFSTAPLLIASFVGVLFCVIAFLMIVFIIVRKLIFGDPVSGWPSLVCIILMTSGVQFFCTGILGQYLAKAYMEVKRRPIYLVKEEI